MAVSKVYFTRPELSALLPQYETIRHVLAGEYVVKSHREKYLTNPSPDDEARYQMYLDRAMFYPAARRTLTGLVGDVFNKKPVIELPTNLQKLVDNANGSGVGLVQHSKKSLAQTVAFSRMGLLVDFPQAPEDGITADNKDRYYPTIHAFAPHHIINWRCDLIGSEYKLTLVVIYEPYEEIGDDGFEVTNRPQYRVLRLNDGVYTSEIWRSPTPLQWNYERPTTGDFNLLSHTFSFPLDNNGEPFDEIPFTFIGGENNDPNPDNPAFYDIARVALSHYASSADYEEGVYVCGQPTLGIIGADAEWEKRNKGKVRMGSRGGINVRMGGDIKLVQAQGNSMAFESMQYKERVLVSLGARLVQDKQVQRTAFEAKLEAASTGSALSSAAFNVQEAYLKILKLACRFTGDNPESIKFELNTDFQLAAMSSDDRAQTQSEYREGLLTFGEARTVLKLGGVAYEEDDIAQREIDEAAEKDFERAVKNANAMAGPENEPTQ